MLGVLEASALAESVVLRDRLGSAKGDVFRKERRMSEKLGKGGPLQGLLVQPLGGGAQCACPVVSCHSGPSDDRTVL